MPYKLNIEFWPLERLIPYARNARTHSEAQIGHIAASIKEFGFNNPVLVDPDGGIIAGHGRVLAARWLQYREVPVIVLGHLGENQKRAFMLADNKIALNAGWDEEMLRLELEALAAQQFPIELTGFEEAELKQLLAQQNRAGYADPDDAPALPVKSISRPGDVWELGQHRLLCGDGSEVEQLQRVLEGAVCELIFTDLPYNVDYRGKGPARMKILNDNLGAQFDAFLKTACHSMMAVSRGPMYLCMSSSELHTLYCAFCEAGGHWSTFVLWIKDLFTLGRSDYQRQYEPILYGWPEGAKHFWCGARDQSDVWFIDRPRRNDLHPTMKPVELVERAIENSSRPGAIVLDPFAGSGTTGIACERTGRQARMIELDPCFADVAVKRWQSYTGQTARLQGSGESFEKIALLRNQESEQERAA